MLINLVLIKKIVRYSLLGFIGLCLAASLGVNHSPAIALTTSTGSSIAVSSTSNLEHIV